jgi:Tol biopolymer transport system component
VTSDNFDLDLTTWLDSVAPSRAPDDLLPVALDRTARVRQRPGWLVAERWTTMQSTISTTRVPRRAFALLIVALIAVAIVAALLVGGVGRAPLTPPRLAIAFTVGTGNAAQIDAMTATGTDVTRLIGAPSNDSGGWTPGGSRLLFGSGRDGNHDEIYVAHPDGMNQMRLTHSTHGSAAAVLSPDGLRIAYNVDTTDSGCYEVFVMNADGSGSTQLTPDGDCNWAPFWTHNGSGLLFGTTRDGNFDIYSMAPDGTNQTRLTTHGTTNDAFPRLSPDGTKIAFTSWDGALDGTSAEVCVMNVDGTGRKQLTLNLFDDSYPDWSPDSKQLVFQSKRDGNFEIYTMNVDGTGVTRLTNTPTDETGPSWR